MPPNSRGHPDPAARVSAARPPGPGTEDGMAVVAGPTESSLDLDRVWRAYLRRFDIEHTFRFAKQVLGWTTPKLRTPGASRPVDLADVPWPP
jgi:hypothetical protein